MNRRALLGAGLAALGGVFSPELGRWYRQGAGQLWRIDAQRIFRPLNLDAMYTVLGVASPGDVVQLQADGVYERDADAWLTWGEPNPRLLVTGLRITRTLFGWDVAAGRGLTDTESVRIAGRFPWASSKPDWEGNPCVVLTSVPNVDREVRIRFSDARESAVRPDWGSARDPAPRNPWEAPGTPVAGGLLAGPGGQFVSAGGHPGRGRLLPSDAETGGLTYSRKVLA